MFNYSTPYLSLLKLGKRGNSCQCGISNFILFAIEATAGCHLLGIKVSSTRTFSLSDFSKLKKPALFISFTYL